MNQIKKLDRPQGQFLTATELAQRQVSARRWLVPDLIPMGQVTLLSGDGGTGKSLLAIQLAAAVASGSTWIGCKPLEGCALYLSAEDPLNEVHLRLIEICRAAGLDLGKLGNLTICNAVGDDARLAVLNATERSISKTELFHEIEAKVKETGALLVVLDTLADLFPGDENDRAHVTQFIGLLKGLAYRHGCAILLLAHPSKSGMETGTGYSGSTAWNNAVRSRLFLSRLLERAGARPGQDFEPDPTARALKSVKSNYGATGAAISLAWSEGAFVVVNRQAANRSNVLAETVFLKLLRLFTAQGRRVNASGGTTYAPSVFAKHPDSEGITKAGFRAALETLLARGAIKIAEAGPNSRRVTHLEESEN